VVLGIYDYPLTSCPHVSPVNIYPSLANVRRMALFVATLALGSRPRQGLARLQAKRKPGSEGKCEGMNHRTPKGASTLGGWSSGGLPNL